MKMGFLMLELWPAKVIMFILYVECFASCANLPRQPFTDIPRRNISPSHRSGFRQEGQAVPGRSLSYIEVSPSQLNGTTEAALLLDFRNGITYDPYNSLSSWNSRNISNYCNWAGVQCSSSIGQVSALNLSRYRLEGILSPSLGGLQFLLSLDLSENVFRGGIPTTIANCSKLSVLDLSQNEVNGSIPQELNALSNLQELRLRGNFLGGFIPPSFSNLSALRVLDMANNQLDGDILSLAWGDFGQLERLDFSNNLISGAIPESLSNCSNLLHLDLSENNFKSIPDILGTLSKLKRLSLSINNIGGGVPASLSNISTLQEVLLDRNQLTGKIPPELGRLKHLSNLDLSSNLLGRQIPPELGNLSKLMSLSLAKNQISLQIPPSIGQLANLQGLILSSNLLTGVIPPELSNCAQLFLLDLSGNFLSGSVPHELGNLTALYRLYLNNNQFTGSLSAAIGQESTRLIDISLAYNNFRGVIGEVDIGPLRNLRLSLDLSHNALSGPIPSGIGALEFVQNIDLSFNAFSGSITREFGACTALQSLDLSFNKLAGQIPQSLESLKLLTYFNVSFNQLTGSVPSSGPFSNFNDRSFVGNSGLCGATLSNKCKSSCSGINCHVRWIVILAVAAGIGGVVAVAGLWFLFIAKPRNSNGMFAPVLPDATHFTSEFESLSSEDIVAATNGFSNGRIIGVGSKTKVFAGVLPSGVIIAVKRLELRNDDRAIAPLFRELQRLSKMEHPNLLKVHAVFSTHYLKMFLLDYMPNCSLHKQLYRVDHCRLTWAQRLNIALGVADAMVHLHYAHSKSIIHLDLKPSNILLDSNMEPKVADYAICRYLNHESHVDTTISSNLYGTIGYIPPEYGALTSVSTKGDVYNFGVVLMELITCKQPTDDMFAQEISLRSWVTNAFPNRISQILDSTLHKELAQNEQDVGIHVMVRLAIACTRNAPKDRLTMIEARDMLLEIKSTEQSCKTGR